MKMDALYEDMKEALKFFGLAFHQMDLVTVTLEGDKIVFTHGDRQISINGTRS